MQHVSRILLALTVLLSGVALVPFVELPAATFEWQRYAGVYEEPELAVNYPDGQPGSYFHFSGTGFSPNTPLSVSANGSALGVTMSDSAGNVAFNVGSVDADTGSYYISVTEGNGSAIERIILTPEAPLRPQEGEGDLFNLPAGAGITEMYLPVIVK